MPTLWHTVIHELAIFWPFIPTYTHLLITALFPIIAGSHASLSRPSSAAVPSKKLRELPLDEIDEEDDHEPPEIARRMEGLAPSDAIVYPIIMGCVLSATYFLLKWLENTDVLNQILNLYLSIFGVLSIAKLATDGINLGASFVFPRTYFDQGIQWEARQSQELAHPKNSTQPSVEEQKSSPLPGFLSRINMPHVILKALWVSRSILLQPTCHVRAYARGILEATTPVRPQDVLGLLFSTAAVLYFNFLDKPWWLTNVLGLSFCYEALQIMSPTTPWTGTLILVALFAYDIYFVFFTPIMITVATSLDVPVKLLFPRPSDTSGDLQRQQFAMLGLGDIVLPGMFIGLALRFDLYLYYLKKHIPKTPLTDPSTKTESGSMVMTSDLQSKNEVIKPSYLIATGNWGERFWLGAQCDERMNGGKFPKTYFYTSIGGYVLGLLCTLIVMHIFKHGQPALLYLVPFVLSAVWGMAFIRGEIKQLWEYSEDGEHDSNIGQSRAASHTHTPTDAAVDTSEQSVSKSATCALSSNADMSKNCLAYVVIEVTGPVNSMHQRLKSSTPVMEY